MLKCPDYLQILKVKEKSPSFSGMSGRGHKSWAVFAVHRPIPTWGLGRSFQLMLSLRERVAFLKAAEFH